jgi:hypothetical protein
MVHCGRELFKERHDAIFKGVYKGSKSSFAIAKLRFIRPYVAIADVDAEISEFAALPPGICAGADGVMRSKLQIVLVKEAESWWLSTTSRSRRYLQSRDRSRSRRVKVFGSPRIAKCRGFY